MFFFKKPMKPKLGESMGKLKECAICRLMYTVPEIVPVYDNVIYLEGHREHKLGLCYIHDIELFKLGQERFGHKYSFLSVKIHSANDRAFIHYLSARLDGPIREKMVTRRSIF